MRRNIFIALLLAGITLALYWPAGRFDLVYFDDPLFVTENPEINCGITGHSLVWACTSVLAANWHPVTNLSFLLTHQFWGASPGAEHWVNAGLHAANGALLYLLLAGLTGARGRSALVAALFAWHPLRVESVAWIAERKDVLSGFFFLLTLMAYGKWVKARSQKTGVRSQESEVRSQEAEGEKRETEGGWKALGFGVWAGKSPMFQVQWPKSEKAAGPQNSVFCLLSSVFSRSPKPKASWFFWAGVGFYALGLMSKAMLVTTPFVLLLLDVAAAAFRGTGP